jgi:Domain of unknown function (DUF2935)
VWYRTDVPLAKAYGSCRMNTAPQMVVYTRSGTQAVEEPFEKPVILPAPPEQDPALHAWADARFATDIMAEHGVFFALLMPPEVAQAERTEALRFSERFAELHSRIASAPTPPSRGDLKRFTHDITEQIKPFIEWKATMGDAQRNGTLRSLVWPLFFDHTRHEAERWTRRLDQLGRGESEFDRNEVAVFWDNIMDEHARFVGHLLDPDETELVEKAMDTSKVFQKLGAGGPGGAVAALAAKPGTVVDALTQYPETSAVLSAAETILDFKTQAARDIEAARIKSIIDPRLADHVRREALKFVDELRRAT